MKEIYALLTENRTGMSKATFSSPAEGAEFTRVVLRPVLLGGEEKWQAERFAGTKVFHLNLSDTQLFDWLEKTGKAYRQICAMFSGKTVTFTARANGYRRTETGNALSAPAPRGNNREKNYLLKEGERIPALVDLGVFTEDYKIKSDKYDKFKQINRFTELVDDALGNGKKEELTIVDFGCGKSYLTFILYYYLVIKKGKRARIIGYDLKADVVKRCNEIAKRYGYEGLSFCVNDVTKGGLYEGKVDAVITLHACDIATDYALHYAIEKNAEDIFSVPCCQHEVNGSIRAGGDFDLLLGHGLLKERFSALLTDAIRAELLKQCGYSVDVLEFVDFSHSPKNIMLRAHKKAVAGKRDFSAAERLIKTYRFRQTLYRLLSEEGAK
jgi:SAM-dependent methyltransferase